MASTEQAFAEHQYQVLARNAAEKVERAQRNEKVARMLKVMSGTVKFGTSVNASSVRITS